VKRRGEYITWSFRDGSLQTCPSRNHAGGVPARKLSLTARDEKTPPNRRWDVSGGRFKDRPRPPSPLRLCAVPRNAIAPNPWV
jgi:hypothetical protein